MLEDSVENSLIANPSLSMDAEHPRSTISISLFSGQKSSHFGQIIAPLLYRVVIHLIKEGERSCKWCESPSFNEVSLFLTKVWPPPNLQSHPPNLTLHSEEWPRRNRIAAVAI